MTTGKNYGFRMASVAVGALATGLVVGTVSTLYGTTRMANSTELKGFLSSEMILATAAGFCALGLYIASRNRELKRQKLKSHRQALELKQQWLALNTHSIVIITSPKGIITGVNEKFTEVYGYSEEEVVNQPITKLYPRGVENLDFQKVHACLANGKMWTGESVMMGSQNNQLVMLGTSVPMYDEEGKHLQNISVRTDITAQKRNKEAHFLKALLDNLTDEVYIFEVGSLSMQYMNFRAIERCGWFGLDITKKRIVETDTNFTEGAFRRYLEPLISEGLETVTVETLQQKGPVEIKTRLYTGADGQQLFISVLRDTTERAELERARLESVSVISHELRTPLTSIKGALRLLQSGALGTMSEKAAPVLDIADRNSDRLLLVVNDILDLEKIRAGKVEFDLKRKDIVAFLREAIEMNKGYADEHGVNIELKTELKETWANIETDRLMQVMSNLISNAAKYSPAGDTITVELYREGKYLRIGVADNGPGIAESDRGSVFESFRQLESPDGVKRIGTGLGLAICKTIVKSHGGRIDYTSKVGVGSNFFIELPSLDDAGNVVPIMKGKSAVA